MSQTSTSLIDYADTLFVIGAAIFTSLLSEGIFINKRSISHLKYRYFMVTHLQTC